MLSYTTFVLRKASVVTAMSSLHSINSENTDLLAISRYHQSIIRA